MTLMQARFLEANRRSPVVYASVADKVTYRLADDTLWTFKRKDAAQLGTPWFAHLAAA